MNVGTPQQWLFPKRPKQIFTPLNPKATPKDEIRTPLNGPTETILSAQATTTLQGELGGNEPVKRPVGRPRK